MRRSTTPACFICTGNFPLRTPLHRQVPAASEQRRIVARSQPARATQIGAGFRRHFPSDTSNNDRSSVQPCICNAANLAPLLLVPATSPRTLPDDFGCWPSLLRTEGEWDAWNRPVRLAELYAAHALVSHALEILGVKVGAAVCTTEVRQLCAGMHRQQRRARCAEHVESDQGALTSRRRPRQS